MSRLFPRTGRRRTTLRLLAASLVALASTSLAVAAQADPGDVVVREDFSGTTLPEGWQPVAGDWQVRDGRLVNTEPDALSRITFGSHLQDFRAEATVRFETVDNTARWAGIILDTAPDGAVPWSQAIMRSRSTASNGIEFATRTEGNTWRVTDTASAPYDAGTGRDIRMVVEVHGSRATWSFDGQQVLSSTQVPRSGNGVPGIIADGARISVDDVVVTELEPLPITQPEGALPLTVAHRGYSSVAPENTLPAIASGIRAQAEYVEIDVQTTADGVPVIMHDGTVDRTTDGTGSVSDLTADYIAGLDAGSWFSPAFAGTGVPTLDQALDMFAGTGSTLLLEVKGPETRAETERVIAAVREHGMTGQVLLQSFDEQVLRDARELAPEIPRGLLRGALDADPLATARELGVVAYNPSAGGLLDRPDVVDQLNDAEIAVMPYTVDDAERWRELAEIGVDAVITNRAGEHVGWRQQPEASAPQVSITAPADGAELRRYETAAVAVSSTDATSVALTLDGALIEAGTSLDLRGLDAGRHTLTATATGPGGSAQADSTFEIVVDAVGVRVLAAETGMAAGDLATLLRHLDVERWEQAERVVSRAGLTAEQESLLLGDLAVLRGRS